jgi:hypothetical protein
MIATLRSFEADLKYGLAKEDGVMEKLKRYFNDDTITNTKELYGDEFKRWDFESKGTGVKWELKSRRNTKHKYDTTLLPCHKTTDGKVYYVFEYTDELCFLEYDADLFKTFDTKMIKVYRNGRYDPPTLHYLIPVHILKSII